MFGFGFSFGVVRLVLAVFRMVGFRMLHLGVFFGFFVLFSFFVFFSFLMFFSFLVFLSFFVFFSVFVLFALRSLRGGVGGVGTIRRSDTDRGAILQFKGMRRGGRN